MKKHLQICQVSTLVLVLSFGSVACVKGSTGGDAVKGLDVQVSEGFRDRQQAYLNHCSDNNAPPGGGLYGQVCRVYTGQTTFNEKTIRESLEKINLRKDTSDFNLTGLLRMLYLDRDRNVLPADLKKDIEQSVLDFKYWLDEPGPDTMVWWSENHQILFHTAELLAGQLFPDTVFSNSGMTGKDHIEHALPLLHRWIDFRARFGFSEFHSNVYFNEDMPPLVNLVDFAEDPEVRTRAATILDLIGMDLAFNMYKGLFATAHGRTYPSKLLDGLSDSTRDVAWIMLNNVPITSVVELGSGNFTAAFVATSDSYAPPALLEQIAVDSIANFENRQRDSIDIAQGPGYGITYRDWEDIIFWWGMTGYIAPEIIEGTLATVSNFTMWNGYNWKDMQFLEIFAGSSVARDVAESFAPMARGVALEAANVYTWRTPDYQLSGLQSFKPSSWTAQVHIWQATLDQQSYVFTTYPGGSSGDYMGGQWTGGFAPKAVLHKSVAILEYRRPQMLQVDGLLDLIEEAGYGLDFVDYTHAYFPRDTFDQVVQIDNWTFGKKGKGYVALWSQHPVTWSAENRYELIAPARENIWILELGDATNQGSFDSFVAKLIASKITTGDQVRYESPFSGIYAGSWDGTYTVDGQTIYKNYYPKWSNQYVERAFDDVRTELVHAGQKLTLDYRDFTRKVEAVK